MLPREFHRRLRADAKRREADGDGAWGRALLVTNHLRTLTNATVGKNRLKPLTLEGLKAKAARAAGAGVAEAGTREDWERLARALDERRGRATA